ncbi:MAG: NAD(P)-dependent oxidoreductase [Ignavibacteriales bacterium]|nr:NAD(P)-dependent oxidoreductase [Ignavibacteriales bacterium]
MNNRIGFIGLGLMGTPIATRLLNAGNELSIYNRTQEKAKTLLAEGAHWRETPADVARQSEIIFSMISTPEALKEIVFGSNGITQGLSKDAIHIDMSTVSPSLTKELAEHYAARGWYFLHSPVLGGPTQAADGTLLLFVGGDTGAYHRVEPLANIIGKQHWHFDRAEQATLMKLLCNSFIAGMITTLSQALVCAEKAGMNPQALLEALSHSGLHSPMYQTKGSSILAGNFMPRFFLDYMLKDINLMLDAAQQLQSPMPALEVTQELFVKAQLAGLGKEDYSAVVKTLRSMQSS